MVHCTQILFLAFFTIYEQLIDNVERGRVSAIIALDQSAYDFVPHEILVAKLEMIGFNPHATEWIKSYLRYRKQVVEIDTFPSERSDQEPYSVIQGLVGSCIVRQDWHSYYPSIIPLH